MFDAEIAHIIDCLPPQNKDGGRTIIAIAGPPAAGKSTLAALLVEQLNAQDQSLAALVPMDGFHLDNTILDARGIQHRKGAPETFDAAGFVGLVHRLATTTERITYPEFDRALDTAIADAATVSAATQMIVLEGNYLLLAETPWRELHAFYDLTVLVKPGVQTLERRLLARWAHYGLDAEQAHTKAFGNDIPNAHYVLSHSVSADLTFEDPG